MAGEEGVDPAFFSVRSVPFSGSLSTSLPTNPVKLISPALIPAILAAPSSVI